MNLRREPAEILGHIVVDARLYVVVPPIFGQPDIPQLEENKCEGMVTYSSSGFWHDNSQPSRKRSIVNLTPTILDRAPVGVSPITAI
jgi:hypothetical protein